MKKRIFCMISGLLALISCSEYDEVAMWNRNEELGSRLAALEELCDRMNTNIVSLQRIVEALQANDYVTGVAPVVENGQTIGYTITFSKSGPVTIYHGRNGANGTTPLIGLKQDADGQYYWTLDGEWLLDDRQEKVPAQGPSGKSAYELAVEKGYRGTLDEWLASLNGTDGDTGQSAYELAVEKGYQGTEEEWLASLKGSTGADGKSAYELAVEKGYQGTEEEWLASLNGTDGDTGQSAYELAVEKGYQGTEEEWLASLKGSPGEEGDAGTTPQLEIRDGSWYVSYDAGRTWRLLGPATGEDGDDGRDGDSMFSGIDTSHPDYITLTLAVDGTEIRLPRHKEKFDLLFISGDERLKEMTLRCGAGATVEVDYELQPAGTQAAVECITHSDYAVSVDRSARQIRITAPADPAADDDGCEILVFASDDERTVMRKLIVEPICYIRYKAARQLDGCKNGSALTPRFAGEGSFALLPDADTYDPATGEGAWAYTGTLLYVTDAAFSRESDLTEITLPASVREVGYSELNPTAGGGAFQDCTNLVRVTFEGEALGKINHNTFNGCSALASIDLPASVTRIAYNAFQRSGLTAIHIPDGVTVIEKGAFVACAALEEAIIGDGVAEIANNAFADCTALKRVVIGRGIRSIGDMAFNTRSSWDQMTLESVTVLFDDIDSGEFPTLAAGSRGAFPKPGGWDPVTYKILVPKGTGTAYRQHWSAYSSLIQEME